MRRFWVSLIALCLALALATPAFADTSYTVRPGDTLTKIAALFHVTVEEIVRANHLADPNTIRVGQVLVIPDGAAPTPLPVTPAPNATPSPPAAAAGETTYVVQSGDSLSRLAARFNVTIEELMTANHLTTTTLWIGQVLVIPGPAAPATPSSVYSRISGSSTFIGRVRASLDWLQAHDLEAFQRVDTYISVITPSPYYNLAQAIPGPNGSCLVRALARWGQSVEMISAMLYHEASHCYQFATVGLVPTKDAEVFAYSEQIAFMERNDFPAEIMEYYHRVLAYYTSQPDDGRYIPPPDF